MQRSNEQYWRRDSLRLLALSVISAVICAGPLSVAALGRTPHTASTRLKPRETPATVSRGATVEAVSVATGLDESRTRALTELLGSLKRGEPFTADEGDVLRTFAARKPVSTLAADLVLSRALYARATAPTTLTPSQRELLERSEREVARHAAEITERKSELQAKEIEAAKHAAPRPELVPSNDTCAGAEVIPASGPFPYLTSVTADITDATTAGDPPTPSCQANVSRSIWYSFTPTATGLYSVAACADGPTETTVTDTVVAIYTSTGGCAGPFTEMPITSLTRGCDDDSCASLGLQSLLTTQLQGGTTYFIVVWKGGTSAPLAGSTAVQLRVSLADLGVNDTCSSATTLTLDTPISGSLVGANDDYELSGSACFTGANNTPSTATGRDVVYTFIAPSAGTYSFRVTNFTVESNLVLYAASSCPPATPGTPVVVTSCIAASNRTIASPSEELTCVALTAGQHVSIFVDEAVPNGAQPTFTIEATACVGESESNGTPAAANPVACGIEGAVGTAGDVDFFALGTHDPDSRVFALVDGISATSDDFDLRVTTSTDTLEYDEGDNDTPFGSNAPNVAGVPLPSSAAFLRVSQSSAGTASGPYRLYSVVQPPSSSATLEVEPNDTPGQATVGAANYFAGALAGPAPSTDVDLYEFSANAGDLIFVSLDADPERNNSPINAKLMLLDASGTPLVSVNDPDQGTLTSPSPGTLTGTSPAAPAEGLVYRVTSTGTYFARVSAGTSSTASPGEGNYLLSISTNCAAGGGIGQSADLVLTKSANPSPAVTGQSLTYTITVSNVGPNPATDVMVSDPLPAGVAYQSCSVSGGTSCSGPPVGQSGTVTATFGTVMPSTAVQLTIVVDVTAPSGQTLSNSATVTSSTPDPNSTNNSSTVMTPVSGPMADLSISNSDSPDPVNAGANLTYGLFVVNAGPSSASNVVVSQSLPSNTTFVSASAPPGWSCTTPPVGSTGMVECSTASLGVDENAMLVITVHVNPSTPTGTILVSPATVSSDTADPDTDDNTSTASTEVIAGVGPGTDTIGTYVASTAAWFLRNSNTPGPADIVFTYGGASAGLVALSGDWDGDGIDSPGVYDPASGFFFLRNSNTPGGADIAVGFGPTGSGVVPIVGDWNGDGVDTVGVYLESGGVFFLRNSNTPGPADITVSFGPGGSGVLPIVGDYDGDGDDTVGVYLQSSGVFFLKNSNTPGGADLTFTFGAGGPDTVPVVGDYDGDGDDSIGIVLRSSGTFFLKNTNASGSADVIVNFGPGNADPVVGDWDGM